jgi:predicted NBD/HSP70 family sugar kinase
MIYVPSRMGQLNRRALLRQLQKLGVASRADLAKSLGLSQPTAGKIVDELLKLRIVEEIEAAGTGADEPLLRGRPGRRLRLNQSEPRLLGIQLGLQTTHVAGLTLGTDGEDVWQCAFDLDETGADPAHAWEKQLRAAARKIKSADLMGVLLSVPGIVDETSNRVLFSPNQHWTEQADLAAIVRRVWNVPVLLVQEERALALGHHYVQPDCDDFLLVDFGEGVGGAIIMDGKPLTNPLPISGEIGHTPVLGNHRRCGCGAIGCMETLVSMRGLLTSFAEAQKTKMPAWTDLQAHVTRNGVPAWLAQSMDAAATAIVGVLNVVGLRRVIITGSLAELPAAAAHLSQSVQNGSLWAKFGSVECQATPRHRLAGLVAIGIDRLIAPDTDASKPAAANAFSGRQRLPKN